MRDTDGHHGSQDTEQDDPDLFFLTTCADDDPSARDNTSRRKGSGTGCIALVLVVVLTLVLATCTALLLAL